MKTKVCDKPTLYKPRTRTVVAFPGKYWLFYLLVTIQRKKYVTYFLSDGGLHLLNLNRKQVKYS